MAHLNETGVARLAEYIKTFTNTGAVPVNHASANTTYGIGTPDEYGHVKAAFAEKLLHYGDKDEGQDPDLWYDYEGNLIGDNEAAQTYLEGVVPNMWLMTLFNDMANLQFENIDREFVGIIEVLNQLEQNKAPKQHASQHQSPNVILWDGDETGHTVVVDPTDSSAIYVHVSDVVPTEDEIYDNLSAFGVVADGVARYHQVTQDLIEITNDGLIILFGVMIVPSDNFTDTTYGLTFAKKGIYFVKNTGTNDILSYFYLSGVTLTTPSDPLTAEMIGAAPASHEHNAEAIIGGTFGSAVRAGDQSPSYSLLRNSRLILTTATANPSSNGEIYWTYE